MALLLTIVVIAVFMISTTFLLDAASRRREESAKLSTFAHAAVVKRRLDAQAFEAARAIQEAIHRGGGPDA